MRWRVALNRIAPPKKAHTRGPLCSGGSLGGGPRKVFGVEVWGGGRRAGGRTKCSAAPLTVATPHRCRSCVCHSYGLAHICKLVFNE